ncbi:MAG: methyltransferase domain-containing protein, partial [Calditrichaeota bacterium]|nr:methyltransferase domain-containing protein [Calditrichota bacterium]
MPKKDHSLSQLYDHLSRFTIWIKRFSAFGKLTLTMHKRLQIPPELTDGYRGREASEFINDLTLKKAGLQENQRILDAGCGFGGTIFRWLESQKGYYTGYTLSPYQHKIASREARRRQLTDYCRFQVRNFEEPLKEKFDVIVAIESLLHANELKLTMNNFREGLVPGGKIIIVDDVYHQGNPRADIDVRKLMKNWFLPGLWTRKDYMNGFRESGLRIVEETDLTGLVPVWSRNRLKVYIHFLEWISRIMPRGSLKLLMEAHLGGFRLQRLYSHKKMKYLL